MWILYKKAETFKKTPSELLRVDPDDFPLISWSLDNAVLVFGTWVEGKLAERVGGKGREANNPKWTLRQLLTNPEAPATSAPKKDVRSASDEEKPASGGAKFGSLASLAKKRI